MKLKTILWGAGSTLQLLLASQGHAQVASDAGNSPFDSEIVVTAQKRSETLSTIPIAATAVGQAVLDQRGAVMIDDLAKIVPNLSIFSGAADGAPQITMRGVGSGSYNPNVESTVIVYLDEFVLGKNSSQGGQMFDLERVEVLRGPQGTLYGKNATGGAINFITRKPDGKTEADAKITVGRYGEFDATAGAQTALTDNLSIRVAANRVYTEGYGRNLLTGKDAFGTSIYGARVILRYKNDTVDAVLKSWFDLMNKAVQDYNIIGVDPATGLQTPNNANPLTGWIDPPGKRNVSHEAFQQLLNKNFGTTLNLSIGLGDYTLSSVTGAMRFIAKLAQDSDASPFELANVPNTDSKGWELSQEIRLASPDTGAFTWIVGASAFRQTFDLYALYLLTDASFQNGVLPPGAFLTPPVNDFFHETTTSLAGFADGSLKLGGGASIFAGLRLTNDKKSSKRSATTGFTFLPPNFGPYSFSGSKSWTKPTYRVGVNWQADRNTLLYVSYNRGYRSGGYDSSFLGDASQLVPFNPEYVDSFEGGVKASLFDRHLRLSTAIYHMTFKDMQLFATRQGGGTAIGTSIINAGKARIYGIELEGNLILADNFNVSFEGEYTNTRFLEYFNGPNDYSGSSLPDSPKYRIRVNPEYRVPYKGGSLFFSPEVAVVGRSRVQASPDPYGRDIQKSYVDVNGQLGYRGQDFSVFAWARNLTNRQRLTGFAPTYFLGYVDVSYSPPRSFGLTATANFR